MTIERDKFPIVLTIIENFGLSSSFTGNAVASANPGNFYSMWERNPHTVLYPNNINHNSSYENEEIDLTRLFAGREVLSDKQYFDQVVKDDRLKENEVLNKLFKEVGERNAALHLVGNLPAGSDRYADLDHLLYLLEVIKTNNIYRVYLHLIVDDNLSGNQEFVDKFISKINQTKSCEIASVIGENCLDDFTSNERNFTKAINTIVFGQGDRALSPEQALSFRGVSEISQKKPTSVLFRNRFACKLSNFDAVIFFNHNNKSFTKLIITLATGNGLSGRVNRPKILNVASMFNPLDQDLEQLLILYNREATNTIAQALFSSNVDQLYLSDSSRIATVNRYLKGEIAGGGGSIKELFAPILRNSNPAYYDQVLDLILKQLDYFLGLKKIRFFTFLIPVLSSPAIVSFAQTAAMIKLIDKFLPKLEELILKHDGALILTSDHAGTEKMSERNEFEVLNSKTNNPIPFILTIPGYKGYEKATKGIVSHRMFYDMIKKSHSVADFAPTILELAGAEIPASMTGKSFLSELKKIEIKEEPYGIEN
jgi:2,3-bisphosphoglycerate-independent phosphoglycerate mutase